MNTVLSAAKDRLQIKDTVSRPVLPGVLYRFPVSVNGKSGFVDGFYEYYPKNVRISMRQLSLLFAGTDKSFSVTETENGFSFGIGEKETSCGCLSAKEHISISVNGKTVRYPSTVISSENGTKDIFLNPADFAMMLDISASDDETGIAFRTDRPFFPDLDQLEKGGYFQNLNALTAVDLTGETVYYEKDAAAPYPIASISKLMTVLIVLDEVACGRMKMTDTIAVSENAEALSVGEDAMIRLYAGKRITVSELLYATLVCSSNECALVLAETVSGSETAFVEKMREKAAALGMRSAEFVNCHGLPFYTNSWAAAKIQNRVSAHDLIILTKTLLEEHPEILTFTYAKEATLPSLGITVRSTNPLLHNVKEVNGFKTGSTNKAGNCLITTVRKNGKYGAVVLLGAESSEECNRKSEIMTRYLLRKL